jgi:hypothetical protein
MLNILVNCLLVWTHLLSCIFLVIEGCVFLYVFRRRIRVLAWWLLPQAIHVAVWWYVWGATIDFAGIDKASGWKWNLTYSVPYLAMLVPISGIRHWSEFPRLAYVIFVFAIVLMTVMLVALAKRSWKTRAIDPAWAWVAFIGLSPMLVLAFSKWVFPIFQSRYLPYSGIGVYLMMALGLGVLPRARWPVAIIVVTVFAVHLATIPRPMRPDWNRVGDIVNDGRPVIVLPAYARLTLGMLDPKIVSGASLNDLGQALAAHASIQDPGLWVVLPPMDRTPAVHQEFDRTLASAGFRYDVTLVGGGDHAFSPSIEVYNLHPKQARPAEEIPPK